MRILNQNLKLKKFFCFSITSDIRTYFENAYDLDETLFTSLNGKLSSLHRSEITVVVYSY